MTLAIHDTLNAASASRALSLHTTSVTSPSLFAVISLENVSFDPSAQANLRTTPKFPIFPTAINPRSHRFCHITITSMPPQHLHPLALLTILLTILPCTLAKTKSTPTLSASYPCLIIAHSVQKGATKLRPNFDIIKDESAVWFSTTCNIGDTDFTYECAEEKCCKNTKDYDGRNAKAKLPKVSIHPMRLACPL